MKKNVEFIFPYGAEIYNEGQINRIGLEIIYIIETSEIEYNTAALNMMFNEIDQKCNVRIVMFGHYMVQLIIAIGYLCKLQVKEKKM